MTGEHLLYFLNDSIKIFRLRKRIALCTYVCFLYEFLYEIRNSFIILIEQYLPNNNIPS